MQPMTHDDASDAARIERVRGALRALGHEPQIIRSGEGTHTAADAARVAGCELGQIIKTLVVYVSGRPMFVLVAGDRRLDDRLLAAREGVGRKQVKLASAEQVLELTGYPIGGVSPFGTPTALDALLDESLKRFDTVWIAAGTADAILPIPLEGLRDYVNGEYASVAS
jgi:Cys-tRNA(Pro) deacylase